MGGEAIGGDEVDAGDGVRPILNSESPITTTAIMAANEIQRGPDRLGPLEAGAGP
jgi:hypothetical protein